MSDFGGLLIRHHGGNSVLHHGLTARQAFVVACGYGDVAGLTHPICTPTTCGTCADLHPEGDPHVRVPRLAT